MDIKEILKKLLEGKTLTEEEREAVAAYDPEANDRIPKSRLDAEIGKRKTVEQKLLDLQEKLDTLQEKLDESESKGLTENEKLVKEHEKAVKKLQDQLTAAEKERDEAQSLLKQQEYSAAISEIAKNHRFDNAEFLEYLITRKKIDHTDAEAVKSFMAELEKTNPNHFQSDARSGSGSAAGENANTSDAASENRLKDLLGKKDLSPQEVAEVIKLSNQNENQEQNTNKE